MKNVYLLLAVVGAVLPYVFFIQHFSTVGIGLPAFLAAVFDNPAAAGAATDLVISSVVFWVLLFGTGDGARAWYLVPLNLLIGLSCALPLWLYLRAREVDTADVLAGV